MATELAVGRFGEAGFIEQADILEALGGLPKDSETGPVGLQHAESRNPGLPQP